MDEHQQDRFVLPYPGDERRSWVRDATHAPRPVTALAGEYWALCMECPVLSMPTRVVNGCLYVDPSGGEFTKDIAAAITAGPLEHWENQLLPRIQALCRRVREDDYASVSPEALAARFPGILRECADAFALTMEAYAAVDVRRTRWLNFCKGLLPEGGEEVAMVALGGHENESAGHAPQLARLAALARDLPEVAEVIRSGRFDAVRDAAGGQRFWSAFEGYLAEWGRGLQSWGDLHEPTFEEAPRIPLRLIAARLAQPASPPGGTSGAAEVRRAEAIARLETACKDGSDLEQLHRLLDGARDYVPVIEGRAKWQLQIAAAVRRFATGIGRKLVERGLLAEANDATFFTSAELLAMVTGSDAAASRAEAAKRKADLQRWATIDPPYSLGQPIDDPDWRLWSGVSGKPSKKGQVVQGIGVSRGIARGIARVVKDLGEADGLGPGDILVTESTTPMWTPLFSVAAAVVTNFGGILSHAAIEAREYGIVAVVGTQTGTRSIPDGARVTVDGEAGTITIEP
jgi:pyruvate,water dikinase